MQVLQIQRYLAILLGVITATNYSQSPIGTVNNDSKVSLSSYSASLSNDNTILAIGTHEASNNSFQSGCVRVYQNKQGVWKQIGQTINGEAEGDWSGYSVSLSGDGTTVAIGAKRNYGQNGKDSGHVRIYENNNGVWKQVGDDIDGVREGDWSGYSVSLSEDGGTVAIGAVLNNKNGANSGHVRVFKNISNKWIQAGGEIKGKNPRDYFGASVSLSNRGDMLAVGAHQGGASTGYVSVYKNEKGDWRQVGDDIVGASIGSFTGWNINLSNNGATVAIAAYNTNTKGKRYAYVRTYQNKLNAWIQQGKDIDGKSFGYNLSGTFNNINLDNDNATIITLIGVYEKVKDQQSLPRVSHLRKYKYKESTGQWVNTAPI